MKAHCLFEQSGTFKNEFIKLGIEAIDYDIQNDYGQTDVQIDLFEEIRKAYRGGVSIFDTISKNDMIMAFFPCVRFEDQIILHMRCDCGTMRNWDDIKKLEYSKRLNREVCENFELISNMVIVCIRKGLRLIIENPYSPQHYLKQYWCMKPKLIDKDRTLRGDWMKKPTQYWFINCEPQDNFILEPLPFRKRTKYVDIVNSGKESRTVRRSKIMPEYANRFIREFILDETNDTLGSRK